MSGRAVRAAARRSASRSAPRRRSSFSGRPSRKKKRARRESPGEPTTAQDATPQTERLRRREADWIARRLRGMLDSGEKIVWDAEAAEDGQQAARPVRPGDIAILFRALTDVEYYEEALRRWGIDYYLVGGHAFYAQQEIYDVVNLLRVAGQSGRRGEPDRACCAARCSHCWTRRCSGWRGIPRACRPGCWPRTLPAELGAEQAGRVRAAAATLAALRAMKDRVPIAAVDPGGAGPNRL